MPEDGVSDGLVLVGEALARPTCREMPHLTSVSNVLLRGSRNREQLQSFTVAVIKVIAASLP